jgi:transcriptional regulator with XRE-family HTH domain
VKLTEKLDKLMKERGITKADLARESGIPYTTITSLYDKGYDNVKLSTLKKLANYFGCSLDYIADDDVVESKKTPTTIAAHLPDDVELTEEESKQINDFIQFIITRKKQK